MILSFATATVTDIEGNVYETVLIGDQLWMQENLKVTHYQNGDEIPTGLDNDAWGSTEEGAYSIYNDDPANAEIYGNLYNWYTVDDDRGICPEGWHIPSDDEWTVLTDYLGGTSVAGGKMKEAGLEHWNYYSDQISSEATNESGFTGLPAGYRSSSSGGYYDMGFFGYFWSSTEYTSVGVWFRWLGFHTSGVGQIVDNKQFGFSIRCLRD